MGVGFVTVFLWVMIYSFVGWVYESTLCSITGRKLVNRGFLNGPICPIYGFGAVATVFFLQSSAEGNVAVLFVAGAVLTCTLEYITSWAMEKLFQTRWWDYSHFKFNINGRVCLEGALAFGFMAVLLLKLFHPIVAGLVEKIPRLWQNILFVLLLTAVSADTFVTIRSILSLNDKLGEIQAAINLEKKKNEQRLERLRISIAERNAELKELLEEHSLVINQPLINKFESSEFYSERISRLLQQRKYNERRLLKAFPRMQSIKNGDALLSLKNKIKNNKK
ncbi:MAG: putative ABC transporter permease [Oscillospiraceae bacterium]